jgi:hypothetical protein
MTHWFILQRPHAATTRAAETFDGIQAVRRTTLPDEPSIDQGVSEPIREGISQQSGQPFETPRGYFRERENIRPERHLDRRDLDSAADEIWLILE